MDMGGAAAAGRLEDTVVAAAGAGLDLMLLVHAPEVEGAVLAALASAIRSGRIDRPAARASRDRVWRLRTRLAGASQPPLEVVGSAAHRDLAREIAEASVTLVRDPARRLPIRAGARVCLLAPELVDLTPAETSSHLRLGLAVALRERGVPVEELVVPLRPTPAEVAALVAVAGSGDLAIVGTFDAVSHPGQADLVRALADRLPLVAVALRSPYDVAAYPDAVTAACTYGVQPPQVEALADALVGRIPFAGTLPVAIPRFWAPDATGSPSR